MTDILEGTFKTPLGDVPKKTAVLVGGGVALLLVVLYIRGRKQDKGTATDANADINPATGYAYGSAEDLAALAAQGGSLTAVGGSGGGFNSPAGNVGFTSNSQWVQSTIAGMTSSGIIEDAGALSVALGKYIGGQPVGDDTTMRSLIEQAIAFNGKPPEAGPNGYPPAINTQNPIHSPSTPPAPGGLPTTAVAPANVNLYDWTKSQGVDFIALFGLRRNDMNALNPWARNVMHWDDSKPNKIPTFITPQTLRIR